MSDLDKAITNAEVKDEKTTEDTTKQEDKESDKGVSENNEEEAELEQAKQLYKALKNPASAKMVIKAMAEQAGLLSVEGGTKEEKKEAKKAIASIFKEHLGEKFGFMADEFGAAIEKVFEHYDSEQSAKFNKFEQDKVKNTLDAAVEKLYATHEDASKYEDRIFELMDEISAGEKTTPEAYLKRLYQIAKSEATEKSTKFKIADKIKNNSEDATTRLSSSSSREEKTNSKPKMLDLDDALEAAVASLGNKKE